VKKSMLYPALANLACAAVLLWLVIAYEFRVEPLLCGFLGGCAASGVRLLGQFLHWSRPENAEAYARRQKDREIDLHDERKEMLRMRSARILYRATFWAEWAAVIVLAVLAVLGIGIPATRIASIAIAALAALQFYGGWIVYRQLEKKY